jgi:uncharacterized protein YlxW (UPF0749 family)
VTIGDVAIVVLLTLAVLAMANVGGVRRTPLPVDQDSLRALLAQLTYLLAENERLTARVRELKYQLEDCRRSGRGAQIGMGMVNRPPG